MSSTLAAATDRAVTFLTTPLAGLCPPRTLIKLRHELYMNLSAFYAPSWASSGGSGRRALTLAPGVPPRPIYNACAAAGVQWNDWLAALAPAVGAFEFDLFVNPGHILFRAAGRSTTVWAPTAHIAAPSKSEVDELFAMIDSVSADEPASWLGATLDAFPRVPGAPVRRAGSPTDSLRSTHSRSSSFSTASSASGASFSSVETDSTCSMSPVDGPRRGRRSPVFIDASKKEVTPYDGGKTTVLTGGVMLGAPAPMRKQSPSPVRLAAPAWRASRW
jgi:hypothetical protein